MFSEQTALFVIPNTEELTGIKVSFEYAQSGFLLDVEDSPETPLGPNIRSVHLALGGDRSAEGHVRNHLFGIIETRLPPDSDIELYVDDLQARFKASDFGIEPLNTLINRQDRRSIVAERSESDHTNAMTA